jgi:GH35 family endo-1,4-beta-xylanase
MKGKIKKLVSILTATAIIAGMLFSAPNMLPVYATEVVVADTFEVNFDGWTNCDDPDVMTELTAHPGEGVNGSRALKLSNRSCSSQIAQTPKGFYLYGGITYTYSIFVKADTSENFTLSLEWLYYDEDITESAVIAAKTVQAGVWTELTAVFTAPEGTENLTLILGTDSVSDFWFDEFKATRQVRADPFAASANVPANPGLKDYYANHFRVGNILNGTTVRNNAVTALILREYNSITMENEAKVDATMTQSGSTNDNIRVTFNTGATAIMDFCVRNNIAYRGHTLTWHGQTPDWFFIQNMQDSNWRNYRNGAVSAVPWATQAVMNQRHESYIRNKFAEYRRLYPQLYIYAYDVVNEFVRVDGGRAGPRRPGFDHAGAGGQEGSQAGDSPWQAIYGANSLQWLQNAFRFARSHAPEHTKLFYNDYNEFDPPKRDYIINSIITPLWRDNLIDGMGMQGHIGADPSTTHWSNLPRYREAMTRYAAVGAGFEVQITELDIVTNQGNDTDNSNFLSNQPNVYRALFEHAIAINAQPNSGSFTAIIMWGPDDGNSWITRRAGRTNAAPLLHDRNLNPKPAYTAVAGVVPQAQWGDGSNPEFRFNSLLSAGGGVGPVEPNEWGWFFHDTFEGSVDGWEARGGASIETSGRTFALGAESLAIRNRTETWHGAAKNLNPLAFVPGNSFSFSVCAVYLEGGNATEELSLTLEHTLGGETRWTNIARADAPRGQWVQLHNPNFAIPAGATNLRLVVESPSNAAITLYIDEAIGAVGGVAIAAPEVARPVATTAPVTGGTTPATTPSSPADFDRLFAGITPRTSWNTAGNNNPLMTQRYSADPNAMVYNGRVYVYSTNDVYERDAQGNLIGNTYGSINTINVKSSADMVNWTDHGAIPAAGANGAATFASQSWAPAAAWKNINGQDRFFLYFCNNASGIVVLTSDSPIGPWTSPRNRMLVDRNTPGTEGVPWVFDPAVLVDDDGQGYLYFGGGVPEGRDANPQTARVIRLSDDMVNTVGSAVMIDAPYMFESSGIFKRGNTYYYNYSANFSSQLPATVNGHRIEAASIQYMTSSSPMGPFTHRGTLMPRLGTVLGNWGNSHQDIVEFKGQYYIFYHSLDLLYARHGTRDLGYRSTHADVLNFNADGSIQPVTATRAGVAQIETLNPYLLTRASTIARQAGINVRGVGNTIVTDIARGDWVSVRGANFNTGANSVTVRASSQAGAVVKIANSATGAALGYVQVPAGGSFSNITASVNIPVGTQNIYFIFSAPMEFETWQFSSTPAQTTATTAVTTAATPPTTAATTAATPPATTAATTTAGGTAGTTAAATTAGGTAGTTAATTASGTAATTPPTTAATTAATLPATPPATTSGATTAAGTDTTAATTTAAGTGTTAATNTTPAPTTAATTSGATTNGTTAATVANGTTGATTTAAGTDTTMSTTSANTVDITTEADATTTPTAPARRLLGDTDLNERITINDALEVLKFLAKLDSVLNDNADAMANALILNPSASAPVIGDALEILKFLAKLDSKAGVWVEN